MISHLSIQTIQLSMSSSRNSCERNSSQEKEEWKWKYIIKDEKLGNSIFLFYNMQWDEAMKLLKRGTINVLMSGFRG